MTRRTAIALAALMVAAWIGSVVYLCAAEGATIHQESKGPNSPNIVGTGYNDLTTKLPYNITDRTKIVVTSTVNADSVVLACVNGRTITVDVRTCNSDTSPWPDALGTGRP